MEKSNQLPKTEGCSAEGEPVDLWYYRDERPSRSVPREKREPQAGPASRLSNTVSKELNASGDGVSLPEPNTERSAQGDRARWLLSCIGTNAQAAIPDVIDYLEHCRGLHFVNAQDLLDTLGEISGTNPAAIPYLSKRARRDGSLALRAAAMAYYIDGRTNLLVETCQRLARKDAGALLGGQEFFWFREDHELNEHLVPLLERLYAAPGLASRDQESIMFEFESRSNDATAAIARLLAMQTNASVRVK